MKFRIVHYNALDSTNNLARTLAQEGASEGTVVVTEFQSRGRGQFKRKWISPKSKNLLFSIILRPKFKASQASILTIMAARALVELLKNQYDLAATIKRPNDVLVDRKKIAGILTESSGHGAHIDYVVIGIGLNINSKANKLPKQATSLIELKKELFDRNLILGQYLALLSKHYTEIKKHHKEFVGI